MIDICDVEEFFMKSTLKELNTYTRVCKKWQKYLIDHPEVFWFKYQAKLGNYIKPYSCTFNQLFWRFNGSLMSGGAVIYPYSKDLRYYGDDISLIGYNNFRF